MQGFHRPGNSGILVYDQGRLEAFEKSPKVTEVYGKLFRENVNSLKKLFCSNEIVTAVISKLLKELKNGSEKDYIQ